MDAGLLQLAGLVDAEASLDVMPALRYMLLKIDGTGRAVEGLAILVQSYCTVCT